MHHLISYAHAEHTHKFIMRLLIAWIVPDARAQCMHQSLRYMLSMS
jgi:hypothetical protein